MLTCEEIKQKHREKK